MSDESFGLLVFNHSALSTHHSLLAAFPRGPGLYLNLISLLVVVLVYLAWIRACVWVDQDARQLKLNQQGWNLLTFGAGVVGLGLFWLLPWFPIAVTLLSAVILAPCAAYIVQRNGRVPETERVCTERHLRELLNYHLKTNIRLPELEPSHEVKLLLKPGEEGPKGEPARLRRARTLPGFDRAAQLLCTALDRNATLVQIDPARESTLVRLRIDGALHHGEQLPRQQGEALLPVLKTLAELHLDECRKPQLGEFAVEINRRRIDVQVRSSGSIAGERVVVRLRDRNRPALTIGELGLPDKAREQMGRLLRHDRGLLVIAGMPDSGRTGTGYASLLEIQRHERSTMSLEADMEHRLPHVDQIRLDRSSKESTTAGLKRVFQRDAPSALLIDAPLDVEAVEFAYEQATDHLLILVMEGEDTVAAMARLLDWGLSPNRLAKKLLGVVSQRLVRVLCSRCKMRYKPDADVLRRVNLPADRITHFCRPPEESELAHDETGQAQVCSACQGLGYHGRRAVYELLVMNERIRELLREGAPLTALRQEAIRSGMTPLEDEAMLLVIDETTSIDEMIQMLKTEAPLPIATPSASVDQLVAAT
jgi:general secretion pathway protein E